ncbi:MAG: hypothetical protein AB1611_04855 [bacterium]
MSETPNGQALVCVDDRGSQQEMVRMLEDLGYQVNLCTLADKALEQIKGTPYRVIVLEDGFQGARLSESPVCRELAQMSMTLRRHTFVVLLGRGVKHLDPLEAFSLSANLLVDQGKIREDKGLGAVVQQEISNYAKFYQVYSRAKEMISQGK